MKLFLKNILLFILVLNMSISYSATAFCVGKNLQTKQSFSASGTGETQASATKDSMNNVIKNCGQVGNSPESCKIEYCTSSEY